ncbi:MAG: LapA family protein [Acidimicrobiales bacterium]
MDPDLSRRGDVEPTSRTHSSFVIDLSPKWVGALRHTATPLRRKESRMADETTNERSIRARQTIRIVVWLLFVGVLVIAAAINTQEVDVDWVVGQADMPLWVVIALSALAGSVIGYVARWRRD